jgi:CRISPR-associated endonuclease Csn1
MKKILGLDLGSSSIGWAYIEESSKVSKIKKMGVRIIPFSGDEKDQFSKGQSITVNKDRTLKRTARKTNHRYKIRRKKLDETLSGLNMKPDDILRFKLTSIQLYGLRAKAVHEQISLCEFGRILLHLNQKRGYKSSRSGKEEESGKKLSDYLTEIKERKDALAQNHVTIGEYFFNQLTTNPFFRIKENVFPRDCYIDEFNRIWDCQHKYYPDLLTEEKKILIRDKIIFYQRRLKSQKGLVGKCTFELHHKVTPKSSPLFQVEKIWESINNISLTNKYNELYEISLEHKKALFEHLDSNEKLTKTDLLKILGLKRTDGWHPNEQIEKTGLQGNTTKSTLLKYFKKLGIERNEILKFELELKFDTKTGEISRPEMINGDFEKQPLYKFWHLLYSVEEPEQLIHILENDYGFSKKEAEGLNDIDFKRQGFGNKSARAIRKLLPALMQGNGYTNACLLAGYKHSNSITKEENLERTLSDKLEHYPKNSLRQPVVEKILNQLINIINNIVEDEELGKPDEIRVELARELKQSKEERNRAYANNNETDKRHKAITERLQKEYPGLAISRKVIEKYKLFEQQEGICMYSGKHMELSNVLRGEGIDVDHIIPQSKLFDDSFQNKVLAFRTENEKKDNSTAFDYMKSRSDELYNQFIERVNRLFENGNITKSKKSKLLMSEVDIPDDFINRQLNESRFIAKEAVNLLKGICRDVYSTSGGVTEFLRNQWGYNEVLKQLNWDKYEAAGKAIDGKIEGWSKRDDHRHHAIDALVVACTKQSYIQKLNTLNSKVTREEMMARINGIVANGWQAKKSLLEQYIQIEQPFTTQDVKESVASILVSLKPGKKVATKGRNNAKIGPNKISDQRPLTPRGQLHKEQVYGKIKKYAEKKTPLNGKFNALEKIANPVEKQAVADRLAKFGNDPKKAFKNLDKDPIWLDEAISKALLEVTLWEESFVYKYSLNQSFKEKDVDSIVDIGIREKVRQRFTERAGQKEHPLKNIEQDPIWLNEAKRLPIKSVRCFTGLNNLVPLHVSENGFTNPVNKKTENSKPVDYVSTRNNHHIAIYKTNEGKFEEITVSLWDAVERKKTGIPVIINDPQKTWDYIFDKGIDDQNLLKNLPGHDWEFVTSLQQNELFVFRMTKDELEKAIKINSFNLISLHLYRVQKMSKKSSGSIDIYFRHHLETEVDDKKFGGELLSTSLQKVIIIKSLNSFFEKTPIKVKITPLGKIKLI